MLWSHPPPPLLICVPAFTRISIHTCNILLTVNYCQMICLLIALLRKFYFISSLPEVTMICKMLKAIKEQIEVFQVSI